MSRSKTLLKGTFILTAAGFLTRGMGFFYRIFLSRTFGAEGVGLYQLIFPVYALCFSLTCAGIESALSRLVAKSTALARPSDAIHTLKGALAVSVSFSLLAMLLLQRHAKEIAVLFLREPRCSVLLSVMSYAFPFAAIHSCICGYYLGQKQTRHPALSQLVEQTARIGSVWILCRICLQRHTAAEVTLAVLGLVCGEIFSAAYSILTMKKDLQYTPGSLRHSLFSLPELLHLSLPITGSRVLMNLLQSVEAVSIPVHLRLSGMTLPESLRVYGILTGMALPCILFPSAITNSVSTMMLPAVAELQTSGNSSALRALIRRTVFSCLLLGSSCTVFFFLSSGFIGRYIFHCPEAARYLLTLSFICPFLYTNTSLISILNGIGKTGSSFFINASGLAVRILGIYLFIPSYGILGYLRGLLVSQLLVTLLSVLRIQTELKSPAPSA